MRIVLTDEDFKKLISGGVVEKENGAKIILQDIGYSRMLQLLMEQINK